MALITPAKKYWIRNESGLIDSSITRFYCQFITKPEIGVFLKVSKLYKSIDTPIYKPMETFDLLALIAPSINRKEFNQVVSKVYSKHKQDRGAKDGFFEIARNYRLTCLFSDEWNGKEVFNEFDHPLNINHWHGGDIRNISSIHIQALVDSINIEREWEPSLAHHSWSTFYIN